MSLEPDPPEIPAGNGQISQGIPAANHGQKKGTEAGGDGMDDELRNFLSVSLYIVDMNSYKKEKNNI